MRAERKGVAGRWHAQRLRLAKVDNVEYVLLADMRAGDREEEPLRVAAGAVVPVEEQVVLVAVHVHRAPQVAALEARLEEQPATRHPVGAGGHEYHAVIHDAVEHLPVLGELTPAFGGRLDERFRLSAPHPRQRLYRLRWRQRAGNRHRQRHKGDAHGPFWRRLLCLRGAGVRRRGFHRAGSNK